VGPHELRMMRDEARREAEMMKQQSIGRFGRADEVAASVLWLLNAAASFVIGVGLPVEGDFTVSDA
jgi:NAD(P)-dependent dehydrogenase (short-subunit alcohol dehydrogenase family)